MAGPLAGIRILDLSERSPAAANAGMILSDFGAEVIRVEPEGGDPLRVLAGAQVWLRGQKSVTLGPEQIRDGSWEALRASADVILDTAQPWTQKPNGLLDGWGQDPRQILCVLTAVSTSAERVTDAGSEEALAKLSVAQAEQRLQAEGVPYAVPVPFAPHQAVSNRLMREQGVILTEMHPEAGEIAEVAHTIRFGTSTRRQPRPAPTLGQNTVVILREIGKSDREIEALLAAKVVNAAMLEIAAR